MNNSFSEIPSLPHHPSPEVSDGLLMKETEQKVTTYFSGPADSNDFLAAKRIFEKNILGGTVAISFSNTPENIAQLLSYVQEQRNRPGSTPKGIVAKLIASGLFTEPTKEKKKKEIAEDFYSGKISFGGKADLTDEERALLEENLLKEPEKDFLEDDRAFEGMEETFNELYTSTSTIETLIRGEDLNYYLEFAEKELIDGGMEEVKKDFSTLQTKKEAIKKKEESYSPEERARNEKNKKAATLTERALVLGVSKAEWFGDNVKMSSISEYGDIRQGVDSLVEIVKNKEKSDFLGLGIDVTFRGIKSEKFKNKFFTLLTSIQSGYKNKLKYEKDHNGELLKEFPVPKVLIQFSRPDVVELMEMLKQKDSPTFKEDFKNHPQKFDTMRQLIHQCRVLSVFARESRNSIFRQYNAVLSSLEELSWQNTEIAEMLNSHEPDEVSQRLDELIIEFKKIQK